MDADADGVGRERDVLAEAVTWAVRGLSPRPPVPVLSGVLLEATPEGLTLSAFDSFIPTMVQGRGWVCIALVVFASWRPGLALPRDRPS